MALKSWLWVEGEIWPSETRNEGKASISRKLISAESIFAVAEVKNFYPMSLGFLYGGELMFGAIASQPLVGQSVFNV
jgi:hypothetical protein